MKPKQLLLFGYAERRASDLLAAALRLDAALWDIRFSPRSRRPEWSRSQLQRLLGDRYQHVPSLGNRLYKTEAIELADPEAALPMLDAEPRPIILLCQCRVSATCHRMTAAKFIAARRTVTVDELDTALAALEPHQTELFRGM